MAVALRDLEQRHGRRVDLRVVTAPPRPPAPPRRVFWARRAIVLAVLIGLVVGGMMIGRTATAEPEALARTDVTVVVTPGVTLWDLAERYAPDDADRAAWIMAVADRNDVDPGALTPGDALSIPITSETVIATPR